jgi:hypothetical protein
MKKQSKAEKIRRYIAKYPEAKAAVIALDTGVSIAYVYNVISKHKKDNGGQPKKEAQKAYIAKLRIKKARLQKKLEKLETTPHIPLREEPTHTVTGVSGHTYEMPNFATQKLSFLQKIGGFFKGLF